MPELLQTSAAVDRENPWPGLASFTEDSRAFFFGREKETEELVRLIRRNTLTVLFGQSGLGKSSLLQAGAFPQLREADYLPLYLRLDHSVDAGDATPPSRSPGATETAAGAPQLQLSATLADQVKAALVAAFQSVGADAPAPRADESLWEYFHRKDVDIWSAKNRLLTPVLAFDQFEEIFTLGRASEAQRERGRAFLTELADLVENRAPAALRARFDSGELDISRYNFDKPSCQVVLSLREDFLPDLEGLKHEMRSILHSRMRVKRLNGVQALEIVQRPAPHLIAEGVGEKIVEFVAGARGGSAERLAELEVEPALLSVICRELNERRRTLGQTQITADLVSGNRREILTDFYERSVADLPEDMRAFVEDHLLTKSGFRDNLALETALDFPGVTRPLIDTLVNRRLLRIEDRLGVERVELTHDVLAEVIRGSRDTRQQRLAVEQAHQKERITRRRMWLARTIAAGLLVFGAGVSWIAWRAIHAEREQARLRDRAEALRVEADAQKLAALRKAYASDMNAVQSALASDNLGRARALLDRQRPRPGDIDLRGWEWRYLWQFCQSDAQSILREADNNSIYSVTTSADGKWVAAGTRKGHLTVYNLQTKERIQIPAGVANVRVAFSPRQPVLAIAMRSVVPASQSADIPSPATAPRNHVLLWDLTTRRVVWDVNLESFLGLVFADDGQTLVTRQASTREVSVLRVADGAKLATWAVDSSGVTDSATVTANTSFAVTRDASLAAYSKGGGGIGVIDLQTGRERWRVDGGTGDGVMALAFSPDGKTLASGTGFFDPTIRLWNVADGRSLGRLEGQRGWTPGLAFLSDGKHLVSASGDQTLRLWDLENRSVVRTFRGHKSEVYALTLLPDQQTLVSGCKDGSVYLWNLQAERGQAAAGTLADIDLRAWSFATDGDAIIILETDGKMTRRHGREFQDKIPLLQIEQHSRFRIGGVGFITDPTILDAQHALAAVITDGTKLQVWDWQQRRMVREWSEDAEGALWSPIRFSTDGTRLIATRIVRGSFSFREFELATGRISQSKDFSVTPIQGRLYRALSPDGTQMMLVDAPRGESVKLDLRSGRVVPFKHNLYDAAPGAAYSADGQMLVWPSSFGQVRIFNLADDREAALLGGFMYGVHFATFSPAGDRLAIGSTAFEALTLWELQGYERLLTLGASTGVLARPMFSPDGNVIAGTGSGRQLFYWRAPSWEEIARAEAAEAATAKPPTP